jgi:hypothetical protein
MAPKVLFVLTSHSQMGNTGNPTGWYLVRSSPHIILLQNFQLLTQSCIQPEFAHPYEVLKDHAEITIASPKGGAAPLDPSSVDASKDDKVSVDFLKNKESLWKNTEKLGDFLGRANEFEAVFYVGGHGRKFLIPIEYFIYANG